MPSGAMYIVVQIEFEKLARILNSNEFMQFLSNEQNVFVYPSEAFFSSNFIRITLTASPELLTEACDRIYEFCKKYLK
jgi:tyrosine aminotransferase